MVLLVFFFNMFLFKFYNNYKLYTLKKNYCFYIKLKKFREFKLALKIDTFNFLVLFLKLRFSIIYKLIIDLNKFYFVITNFIVIYIYFFKKNLLLIINYIQFIIFINITLNLLKHKYYNIFYFFNDKSYSIAIRNLDNEKIINILKIQTYNFDINSFTIYKKLLLKLFQNSFKSLKKKLFFIWKFSYGHSSNWIIRNINFLVFEWFIYWYKYTNLFMKNLQIVSLYNFLILWLYLKECYYINRNHTNKSLLWKIKTYFGPFSPYRNDFWVFGNKISGIYILKLEWLVQLN